MEESKFQDCPEEEKWEVVKGLTEEIMESITQIVFENKRIAPTSYLVMSDHLLEIPSSNLSFNDYIALVENKTLELNPYASIIITETFLLRKDQDPANIDENTKNAILAMVAGINGEREGFIRKRSVLKDSHGMVYNHLEPGIWVQVPRNGVQ